MSGKFGTTLKHKSVEWYTPRWVFDELGLTFDLDPASPKNYKTMVPAKVKFTIAENGLKRNWFGRVWLNPPYGRNTGVWMKKLIDHGTGMAMVFSRTDAVWCQEAMKNSTAILFLSGRISFIPGSENVHKKGRAGAGTVMIAFGNDCANALKRIRDRGLFIEMRKGGLKC